MPWKQGLSSVAKGSRDYRRKRIRYLAARRGDQNTLSDIVLPIQSNLYFVFGISCGDELIVKRHAGLLRWKEDIKELLK